MRVYVRVLLFFAAVLLTACADGEKPFKIAVSQCGSGRWRQKVNQEMLAARNLYERSVDIDTLDAHDDTSLQIRQIDSLANTDIDLLVVAPNEAAPFSEAIAKVRKKGIPVIYFDRRAENRQYTAFIGGNNVEAGKAVGRYAAELARCMKMTGRKVRVVEITGAMASSPAQERHRGFAEEMEGNDNIDYSSHEGNWSSDMACHIVRQYISEGRQPDIVFCHNDGMATGVYKATVEEQQEGQILTLGIDGLPGEGLDYVRLEHQVGTYVYPTHGEKIVRLALDILTGKQYERDNELQGMLVTPDNVDIIYRNSLELMRQNRDLITVDDKLDASFGLYNTQHKVLVGSFICIALLVVAILMMWRAHRQTNKAIRQQQTLNEEETLFYTNGDSRKLQQIFEPTEEERVEPKSQDTLFAEQLNAAIRKNMANPNLKMEDLGEEVGLSRVQMYRKVKAITGLTPVELLRQMRLQRGYALLTSTTKTVAEIAYEVGFGTPGYFSKCFRQHFGKYPMDVRSGEK